MKLKTARRWLNRNAWEITRFNLEMGSSKGSRFHKQLLLCRKTVILFENFTNKFS